MRSPLHVVVPALLITLATPVAQAAEPIDGTDCQYVHVVDPCEKKLIVLDVDPPQVRNVYSLSDGMAEELVPGGVDFATVPEYEADFSFLTQGWYLRVVDQTEVTERRVVDLRELPGLYEFWALNVEAAAPVPIDSESRYPLYVIGGRSGEPWLAVLDQQALLAETLDPTALVLASGPICVDGVECSGVGVDIAAGGVPVGEGVQESYASVLNASGGLGRQRFYRIDLHADSTFGVSLDPWNEEGEPFSASAPLALGVDYDGDGLQPVGVFQTSAVAVDLASGASSCALPGDPTDIAVWGPGFGLEHPFFHFVTSNDPDGADLLLGFPAGECPSDSEEFLTLQIGGEPHAIGLSSDESSTPWVFTANREHGISALHLSVSSDGASGDRVRVLDDSVVSFPMDGCPTRLAIRDERIVECAVFPPTTPRPPKVDCEEDPDDPRCADRDDDKKNNVIFGED